jgi:hypothetical protein
MKKFPLIASLCALALLVTACASANNDGFGNGNGNDNSNGAGGGFGSGNGSSFRGGFTRTLSPDAKLALGTIKLEGTAQAVDAETAAKLLPLWQLMVQLHSSSSTAPQEVTATLDEIQATMAPAQLNTINGMSLSGADLFSLLQSQAQASSGQKSGGSGLGSNGGAGRNGGGGRVFFGGGPGGFAVGPAGGGFGGGFAGGGVRSANGSGTNNPTQLTPQEQAQAAQARENAISSLVEDQLIRLLETKLGSRPG